MIKADIKPDNRKLVKPHIAAMFMDAVGYVAIRCVVRRRGKVYSMWADKNSHRKIISDKQLATMTLSEFVAWLHTRAPMARVLFPDPSVYREVAE